MSDKEIEQLAQFLFALHDEALGYPYKLSWDSEILQPNQREAWIQVAEWVINHEEEVWQHAEGNKP